LLLDLRFEVLGSRACGGLSTTPRHQETLAVTEIIAL
jgi:hypothetical protein